MDIAEFLIESCHNAGIEMTAGEAKYFESYGDFLLEYNSKVNLTTITEEKDIAIKHFLDSLMILKYVDLVKGAALVDVGTGAGFPAVPLKLLRRDLSITLLDSLDKRLTFLTELCAKLNIKATNVHQRAEIAGADKQLREKYDYASSRAVAPLFALAEFCLPLLKVGGTMIALKGPSCEEEIKAAEKAIKLLGGGNIKSYAYTLPDGSGRTLVTAEKLIPTPKKYPRQRIKITENPI